jgi:hypothetical protein
MRTAPCRRSDDYSHLAKTPSPVEKGGERMHFHAAATGTWPDVVVIRRAQPWSSQRSWDIIRAYRLKED